MTNSAGKRGDKRAWIHPDIQKTLEVNPDHYSPMVSGSRLSSLRYAVAGWLHMLRYHKNVKIQIFFSLFAFALGLWLHINLTEWAIIVLAVTINWMAEFLNGAIEAAINLASPEIHPLAGVGKDIGAGTSLLAAVASFIIGLLIFLPPLWAKVLPVVNQLFAR